MEKSRLQDCFGNIRILRNSRRLLSCMMFGEKRNLENVMKARTLLGWTCTFLFAAGSIRAASLPPMPGDVPSVPLKEGVDYVLIKVEDGLKLAQSWTKEHPDDAYGFFVLGHFEAMSWAMMMKRPPRWIGAARLPRIMDQKWMTVWRLSDKETDTQAKMGKVWLTASIAAYRRALAAVDPAMTRAHLGLAVMLGEVNGRVENLPAAEVKITDGQRKQFAAALKNLSGHRFSDTPAGKQGDCRPAARCDRS